MKVKAINKNTNQQFDCEEIEINEYKYYIDYSQPIEVGKWYISNQAPRLCVKIKEGNYPYIHLNNKGQEIADFHTWKGVIICTNNPNIDIPKVVDEVDVLRETMVNLYLEKIKDLTKRFFWKAGFKHGYNKAKETHPNSDEDMIEFYKWVNEPHPEDHRQPTAVYVKNIDMWWYNHEKYTSNQIIQIWKEQQSKTVYYEKQG